MTAVQRIAFDTSRLLDFFSEKELVAQTGHQKQDWPLVVLKELVDNSLDACEEAGIAPVIAITVDGSGIAVTDNGPGLPENVIKLACDFGVRISSREAYMSPSRGAQGNALKTILAMPYVLDGQRGQVEIEAYGKRHLIQLEVDRVRQIPRVEHQAGVGKVKSGTSIRVCWPRTTSRPLRLLAAAKAKFLLLAAGYTWINPHLSLTVDWSGRRLIDIKAPDPSWRKWRPDQPTSPHWYTTEQFSALVAHYIRHDEQTGRSRTVGELISEFHGLSGSAKKKAVLDVTNLARQPLSAATAHTDALLTAMQAHSKLVKSAALGLIGEAHLYAALKGAGGEMETFKYKKVTGGDTVPWIVEVAFAWLPEADEQRLVSGINWSPAIINPFRDLEHRAFNRKHSRRA